ncbi:MAG: mechanosensitive ion channel [Xanthomonadales bacterium]|nr:mechanosensitive ion channel [Gammaproteobacteria bacterium]MBT8074728.1 mechanosensitive ion channel [Gammaproteobacteria bacterium]NNK05581.1 mechanosensitive ion channel [Xanthomonadales bacterium]
MDAIKEFITNANLMELAISWGINLVLAIVIFIIGKWIARWLQSTFQKLLKKRAVDPVLVDFLGTVVYALILIAAIIAAVDVLGIPATSFLAILGAAGLAIGLALKDSLSNFASGVMLVLFRPFGKGDLVDAGGIMGVVEEISLVSTMMVTPDNKQIIVPNSLMYGSAITNYSAKDTRRVDMVIGVGYDDDLKVAADVLKKVCSEHPKVLDTPETKIFINNLGDSAVDFVVRPWVKSEDYWGVLADVLETAKVELEAAGCNIPYPQTDVHLHQATS